MAWGPAPASWQPTGPKRKRRLRLQPLLFSLFLFLGGGVTLFRFGSSWHASWHATPLSQQGNEPAVREKSYPVNALAETLPADPVPLIAGITSAGPHRVLEQAAESGGSTLDEGNFGKGQLGTDGLLQVSAPPPPYGPKGVHDVNDTFVREGQVFKDDEPDSEDYREESTRWSKPVSVSAHPELAGPVSGHCLSYYDPRRANVASNVQKVNIKFEGEFGYELMVVLPFAYFHFLNGTLGETVSCGDVSTSMFYWFNPNHRHDASCQRDDFKNQVRAYGWRRGLHKSNIPSTWYAPPFDVHFREWGRVWHDLPAGAPLVVISNKISNEWFKGPINFFDLVTLKQMIKLYVNAGYYVVYNRAGNAVPEDQWQADGVKKVQFDDYKVIRKMYLQPEFAGKVRLLQDIHRENSGISYNEAQVRMMARSRCFVSVQGGNSILSSYFGGTNIIYANRGFEVDFRAYPRLYYRLSGANVLVARSYYRLFKHADMMIRRKRCESI